MHYAAFETWLEHCLSRSMSHRPAGPGGADANEKNAIEIAEAIAALGFKSRQGHEDRRPSVNRIRVSDRLRSARFWQSRTVGRYCSRFATVLERSGAMDFASNPAARIDEGPPFAASQRKRYRTFASDQLALVRRSTGCRQSARFKLGFSPFYFRTLSSRCASARGKDFRVSALEVWHETGW